MVQFQTLRASLAVLTLVAAVSAASAARAQNELLVFSSPFCGPCQQLKPVVAEFEHQGYPVRHVDVTQHVALASKFGVSRVPCLVMIKQGKEFARQLGGDRNTIAQLYAQAGIGPQAAAPPTVAAGAKQMPPPSLSHTQSRDQPRDSHEVSPQHNELAKRLLQSTVRLTIDDASGRSFGTGTIIDTKLHPQSQQEDALVVTCGHLFRGESARGQITVERFTTSPSGTQVVDRVVGQLLSYDLERDVALVAFRPNAKVQVAPVASQFIEQVNSRVYTAGCNLGDDPTIWQSRVTALDRYHGPPNVETSGAPIQGRSGGGLFNERGELVGICFAADNEGDEGLYAGLASVHAELDKSGLQSVYRGQPAGMGMVDRGLAQVPSRAPIARGQNPPDASNFPQPPAGPPIGLAPGTDDLLGSLDPAERAGLEEIGRRAAERGLVVIVPASEPGGKSEVIQIDRVSPQFVEALHRMAAPPQQLR